MKILFEMIDNSPVLMVDFKKDYNRKSVFKALKECAKVVEEKRYEVPTHARLESFLNTIEGSGPQGFEVEAFVSGPTENPFGITLLCIFKPENFYSTVAHESVHLSLALFRAKGADLSKEFYTSKKDPHEYQWALEELFAYQVQSVFEKIVSLRKSV